ncbi:MAG: hypothetical protein QXG00_04585 [Candidatus Woesearchaeota archaeon]
MNLRDINLSVTIEIVDGGFIINTPVIITNDKGEECVIYRRSVVNSQRKAIKAIQETLNEFKLTSEE